METENFLNNLDGLQCSSGSSVAGAKRREELTKPPSTQPSGERCAGACDSDANRCPTGGEIRI